MTTSWEQARELVRERYEASPEGGAGFTVDATGLETPTHWIVPCGPDWGVGGLRDVVVTVAKLDGAVATQSKAGAWDLLDRATVYPPALQAAP